MLEFGFFRRSDRDEARAHAQAAGAEAHLVFLDPPMEELVRRVEARNAALPPDTFPVSKEHVELCATWLERPGADEPLWKMNSRGAAKFTRKSGDIG